MGCRLFQNSIKKFMLDDSTAAMQQIVQTAKRSPLPHGEISFLAQALANSGEVLNLSGHCSKMADIASTGGPSSLSTILGPLFLRIYGFSVPKLGVPGRPAGAIDVFCQLPGYQRTFSAEKTKEILDSCGFVNLLAGDNLAPKDAKLFAYRKQNNAVNIPELAVASLLSKKIAVGLQTVGLDVRVAPHGNFGATWEEARKNSKIFVEVAKDAGIYATCFLTDASRPFQPYIGRSEALVALSKVFDNSACSWLQEHVAMCKLMAQSLTRDSRAAVDISTELKSAFFENLAAQGSDRKAFEEILDMHAGAPKLDVTATQDGILVWDMQAIRKTIVDQQRDAVAREAFPDPIGITLYCRSGDFVVKDQPICCVRYGRDEPSARTALSTSFYRISSNPGRLGNFEIVSNE